MRYAAIVGVLTVALSTFVAGQQQPSCGGTTLETQDVKQQPPPAETVGEGAAGEKLILPAGTKVRLRFEQKLSSATATIGEDVRLVLSEDLRVGYATVAKAGSTAIGTVDHAHKAIVDLYLPPGHIGLLAVRMRSLKSAFGNTYISLSGTYCVRGHGFPWATNAVIKKGQPVTAVVADTIDLLHPY